ncbi:hypothetical protein ACFFYR_23625 [Paraburkholderia dipogonis]
MLEAAYVPDSQEVGDPHAQSRHRTARQPEQTADARDRLESMAKRARQ